MVPDVVKRSPSKLASVLLHQQHTSVLQITPSLMFRFHEDVIREMLGPDSHVRVLAFGGEACPTMETLMKWKSPKVRKNIQQEYKVESKVRIQSRIQSKNTYIQNKNTK